jgi:hypothetical protein
LLAADVYHVLGQTREALKAAETAIDLEIPRVLSDAFAGPFARWLARIAVPNRRTGMAEEILQSMFHRLETWDRIDQIEIQAALLWMNKRMGRSGTQFEFLMQNELRLAPLGVNLQLRRLGMLD